MTPQRIPVRHADLGDGFAITRALPSRQQRMVGAWCFLDHIGPVQLRPGQEMHVGAHPHTSLQTFTWMIRGQILHRDSLGSEQVIRPGEVNLMTAGRGIVHTEDSLPGDTELHAAQLWIALPEAHANTTPAFEHHANLPVWTEGALGFTLLAGEFAGRIAPTRVFSPLVGLDLLAQGESRQLLPLRADFEYGLLVLAGSVEVGSERFDSDDFAYLGQGQTSLTLGFAPGSRVLLLGGEPFAHPVTMWWNFVGPQRAHVIQAQRDWESHDARFGPVPGDGGRRLTAHALPWADAQG